MIHNHHPRGTNQYYEAEWIGNLAYESLSKSQGGSVFGLSSQGVFIKTETKRLIFLSRESFRGPLTINLPILEILKLPIRRGMNIQINGKKFIIPEADFTISFQNSNKWRPKPPSPPLLPLSERRERLTSSANRVLASNKEKGLAGLLPILLNFDSQIDQHLEDISPLQANIIQLQSEISSSGIPEAVTLISLLGSGSGLTPSGDDFICGLLLALNRWKNETVNGQELDRLNREIIQTAYLKTTTLSANLIECATLGQGDERLIETLDWLACGQEEEPDHIEELLGWGSSSGVDVFVGFVIALSR